MKIMQKKIIEIPKFEYQPIQIGVEPKDIWVTSDGKEFENEEYAHNHEYMWEVCYRNAQFEFPFQLAGNLDVYSFDSSEQMNNVFGSVENLESDLSAFEFPNKFVCYTKYKRCGCATDEDCFGCGCDHHFTVIEQLEVFKDKIIEMIRKV